jgi:hypothetical protein
MIEKPGKPQHVTAISKPLGIFLGKVSADLCAGIRRTYRNTQRKL